MLKIYNTLTEKKDDFIPIDGKKVGLYACGMTVYDKPHIGHARKEVAIDMIVSYLRYLEYNVCYVRNFTDVDDKIIQRANERGISCVELTTEIIDSFYKAMDALGLARADVEPKATEHMPEIINITQKLIDNGYAYEANGSVYFAVDKFKGYGKLSGRNLDDMISGTRFEPEPEKRNPLDFALWKTSKPGEPSWDSPWGKGRPGWHIECSAMSSKYLGETFDIHAGGRDLIFPHHENEIAQSEAASGKPFVKYWVHNGFLTVEGEKMSKSLNNFITVDDALEQYHPEALRSFMLSTHYRTPIDFSMQNLAETERRLNYFYTSMRTLTEIAGDAQPIRNDKSEAFLKEFRESMDDDFNSARVIAAFFNFFKWINESIANKNMRPKPDSAAGYLSVVREAGKVLGILMSDPVRVLEEIKEYQIKRSGVNRAEIEDLIIKRNDFRKAKDFQQSDIIRDKLLSMGVIIKDSAAGTEWSFK